MSHVGMVRAATRWPTNGHMIEDVAKLGYLHPDWHTIDANG